MSTTASFKELAEEWGKSTSSNANGGGSRVVMPGDDDKEMRKEAINLKYDLKLEDAEGFPKSEPQIKYSGLIPNDTDKKIEKTEELEVGTTWEATARVTTGVKVAVGANFGVKDIGGIDMNVEVNLENEETKSKSHHQNHKESYKFDIDPRTTVRDYLELSEQTQKIPFKGKLYVEGNVGVYFDNKICNAYGDGGTEYHYKWFPDAQRIVKWAKENGYKNWDIDGDGRAYSVIE
ncbi:unnamed protein product, partial [Didymodactylos carnosus]